MRYFLEIAYDGTAYHGWQIQKNAHSVQHELNAALSALFKGKKIETLGCGRTDTGVHASQFFLHFDLDKMIYEDWDFIFKLNRILPKDISVKNCYEMHDTAHARYDAVSRTYEYHLHTRKDPFKENRSCFIPYQPDLDLMNAASCLLPSFSDFSSFCKSRSAAKTMICEIEYAEWIETENDICFTITADRFLRNMVRSLAGTLLQVGKGVISVEEFCSVIEKKDRRFAGESMPACGLYLTNVTYPYIRSIKL